jgi:hypothetical protein
MWRRSSPFFTPNPHFFDMRHRQLFALQVLAEQSEATQRPKKRKVKKPKMKDEVCQPSKRQRPNPIRNDKEILPAKGLRSNDKRM